ncbi:Alpha/Beta hydrolase protein, partial [Lipomyces japonicus]|uniref:Alpha/Beta hydrolase protein n=1 Tax=Lipomyces japonicus TaxID=56871 RepID=UPI0034CD8745
MHCTAAVRTFRLRPSPENGNCPGWLHQPKRTNVKTHRTRPHRSREVVLSMTAEIIDRYHVRGLNVLEYEFTVPLDYSQETSDTIKIFARRVVPYDEAEDPEANKRPYIVYLQGGPGFECDPPLSKSGRTKEFLDHGYQVLYLDQRGTGFSTPISWFTLKSKESDEAKAEYLSLFRADNIVRDAEEIRKILTKDSADQRWSLVGQSFGGFCAVTYLSFYPTSLKDVLITGGVPPLTNNPDPVYRALYGKLIKRNKAYYAKFPNDLVKVRSIVAFLAKNNVTLPNGGNLSVARFQALGIDFGRSGGLDAIHQLVTKTHHDLQQFGEITFNTKTRLEQAHGFDTNILYACVHEAIYCQGEASNWSAERLLADHADVFRYDESNEQKPVYFTGEMIFKSMFDDFVELRPLKQVAELLALKRNWPALYDVDTLNSNQRVRVAALSYFNDPYVDVTLSEQTAAEIGNSRLWVTSEFLHNGIGVNPSRVLGELFNLLENEVE